MYVPEIPRLHQLLSACIACNRLHKKDNIFHKKLFQTMMIVFDMRGFLPYRYTKKIMKVLVTISSARQGLLLLEADFWYSPVIAELCRKDIVTSHD